MITKFSKVIFIAALLVFAGFRLPADEPDTEVIIKKVLQKYNSVEDYSADIQIEVDFDFLRVPKSKAKMYYKKPDKYKLESDGFALAPKEGLHFNLYELLNDKYISGFVKTEHLQGKLCEVIKIIPISETGKVAVATLWIGKDDFKVYKVETTTRDSGTFSIVFNYDDKLKYPLPEKMIITFNLNPADIPQNIVPGNNKPGAKKGSVIIQYSGYKVNKGLPAKIFEEK